MKESIRDQKFAGITGKPSKHAKEPMFKKC